MSYVVPVKSKMEISQNFVAFSEYMNFNEKDTLQHFQIRENRIRTFVVSVFDLMSLLYVMNSPTYSTVYLCIAKIEWRVERRKKKSELELARQYLRSAR